jgi:hypothetical protein
LPQPWFDLAEGDRAESARSFESEAESADAGKEVEDTEHQFRLIARFGTYCTWPTGRQNACSSKRTFVRLAQTLSTVTRCCVHPAQESKQT